MEKDRQALAAIQVVAQKDVVQKRIAMRVSAPQAGRIEEKKLGYVSDGNLGDPAKQDEVYDRQ